MQESIWTSIESINGPQTKLTITLVEWKNVSYPASAKDIKLGIEEQGVEFISSKDGLCEWVWGVEEKVIDWTREGGWRFGRDGVAQKQSD